MELLIKDLSCSYGMIRALRSVNIHIKNAGIYAIIGANGAGKSTLIGAICGLITPTSGEIFFDGVNLTSLEPYDIIRQGISVCPEGRRIFKSVTVSENLVAGAYICKDKKRIQENSDMVFELFPRLKERRKQIAGTLSGGEQQMLAVGRALMSDPKLILLDEPSMGLAPNLVDLVFESIVKIYKERNIPSIVVEQNSEMALSIAEYAYVLEVGECVLQGSGSELLESDEVRKKYLGV